MPFYCSGCAGDRPAGGLTQPCKNCGATSVDRIPPLDGFCWFGEHPTDEEAKIARDLYFEDKRTK